MLYITNAFSLNMLPTHKATSLFINPISKDDAAKIATSMPFIAAVGHPDIATIIANDLGIHIKPDRATIHLTDNDKLLIAQYIGPRLDPGTTTLPDNAKIQYFIITLM